MTLRKATCLLLVLVCLIPSLALAASYRVVDIYEETVSTADTVFKAGDKITGGSGINFEIYYVDANGETVDTGKGKIKSVQINGKKCSEWKLVEQSAAVMQIGSMIRGSFAFTMQPAYACADNEGYYSILPDTYSTYVKSEAAGKKVKCAGRVAEAKDGALYISVGEEMLVAVTLPEGMKEEIVAKDRVLCKGEVTAYEEYLGANIPVIAATEVEKQHYQPLQEGDSGELVLAMKKRMQELGYYTAKAPLSDEYNDTCVERMRMFQKKNGLPETGTADEETLSVLYSDAAVSKE